MEYEMSQRILNKNFSKSKKFTEETLEIKLSLIELVELKRINEYCHNIYLRDKEIFLKDKFGEDKKSILPDIEAALIFMNKNYGTQINFPQGDWEKLNYNKTWAKLHFGFDYYAEGFKRMQDEMHNRFGY